MRGEFVAHHAVNSQPHCSSSRKAALRRKDLGTSASWGTLPAVRAVAPAGIADGVEVLEVELWQLVDSGSTKCVGCLTAS